MFESSVRYVGGLDSVRIWVVKRAYEVSNREVKNNVLYRWDTRQDEYVRISYELVLNLFVLYAEYSSVHKTQFE